MDKTSRALHSILSQRVGEQNGKPIASTFYYEPGSEAHAWQNFGAMGWNLQSWNGWKLNPFLDNDARDWYLRNYLFTYSHEYAHVLERSGEWTHNQDFYRKQAQVLAHLMDEMRQNPEAQKIADLVKTSP
jgi:hypothetical protein